MEFLLVSIIWQVSKPTFCSWNSQLTETCAFWNSLAQYYPPMLEGKFCRLCMPTLRECRSSPVFLIGVLGPRADSKEPWSPSHQICIYLTTLGLLLKSLQYMFVRGTDFSLFPLKRNLWTTPRKKQCEFFGAPGIHQDINQNEMCFQIHCIFKNSLSLHI